MSYISYTSSPKYADGGLHRSNPDTKNVDELRPFAIQKLEKSPVTGVGGQDSYIVAFPNGDRARMTPSGLVSLSYPPQQRVEFTYLDERGKPKLNEDGSPKTGTRNMDLDELNAELTGFRATSASQAKMAEGPKTHGEALNEHLVREMNKLSKLSKLSM